MASGVGLGASGPAGLTESMDDVALCFTLRDLLRQGLEVMLGWGMAEEVQVTGMEGLFSKEAGTFSLIPGWEEAELADGSFSWLLGGAGWGGEVTGLDLS